MHASGLNHQIMTASRGRLGNPTRLPVWLSVAPRQIGAQARERERERCRCASKYVCAVVEAYLRMSVCMKLRAAPEEALREGHALGSDTVACLGRALRVRRGPWDAGAPPPEDIGERAARGSWASGDNMRSWLGPGLGLRSAPARHVVF